MPEHNLSRPKLCEGIYVVDPDKLMEEVLMRFLSTTVLSREKLVAERGQTRLFCSFTLVVSKPASGRKFDVTR